MLSVPLIWRATVAAVCGRFTLATPAETLAAHFELASAPALQPRYNIAPTQPVLTVRAVDGQRTAEERRWGLVPHWAKDPKIGGRLINARAETVASKPAFRVAFRKRRCLVPADGFYEWKPISGRRQPFHLRRKDGAPFAMAGLFEQWSSEDGEIVDSCTVITTEANDVVRSIHDRMPVILDGESASSWLDPELADPEALQQLLRPCPGEDLTAYPVDTRVNRPKNDGPANIEPLFDDLTEAAPGGTP